MSNTIKFEKALLEHLNNANLSKDQLKGYSDSIVRLSKEGIVVEKIWKYGIPAVDGVIVSGRIPTKDLGKMGALVSIPKFAGCEIFPLGIPAPEWMNIEVRVGSQVQQHMR